MKRRVPRPSQPVKAAPMKSTEPAKAPTVEASAAEAVQPKATVDPSLCPDHYLASQTLGLLLAGYGADATTLGLLTKQGMLHLPSTLEWLPWVECVRRTYENFNHRMPEFWQPDALDTSNPTALSIGVCQQMNTEWGEAVTSAGHVATRLGYKTATPEILREAYDIAVLQSSLLDELLTAQQELPWLTHPDLDTQSMVSALLRDAHRIALITSEIAGRTPEAYIEDQLKRWGRSWLSDNMRRSQILGIHEFATLT